jgi:hypothetical protein
MGGREAVKKRLTRKEKCDLREFKVALFNPDEPALWKIPRRAIEPQPPTTRSPRKGRA